MATPLPPFRFRLWFGGFLAVIGLFWTAVGTILTFVPPDGRGPDTGIVNLAFALILFLLPGALLWSSGYRRRAREERLRRVAALGAVAQRMPIAEVALQAGVDDGEARRLLFDAVSAGLLRGRIDVEAGVFLSSAADPSARTVESKCPKCGASSTVLAMAGDAAKCPFCGAALS